MQKYTNDVATRSGDAVNRASVLVTDASGATATIYSDDGVTPQTNPIITDRSGDFSFYAADGVYTLTISGNGIDTKTISGVLLNDPQETGDIAAATNYTELRAYSGDASTVFVSGYHISAAPSGVAGVFERDDSDTTSADNAGTIIVSADGKRWKRQYSGAIYPKWFGAVRDGVTSDKVAIQAAADYAKTVNGELAFDQGTYAIDGYIAIYDGVRRVTGQGGVIKCISGPSGLFLRGIQDGAASNVTDCVVSGLVIDCNLITATSTNAIWAQNPVRLSVIDNKILNLRKGYGILIRSHSAGGASTRDCLVSRNIIKAWTGESPVGATTDGIYCDADVVNTPYADAAAQWKALFTTTAPTYPAYDCSITDNLIEGGYYGVSIGGTVRARVRGNKIDSTIRGISVQANASYAVVEGNTIVETYSSGVHLAYGASNNLVRGNRIVTTRGAGEALLQAYVGATGNKFDGNYVETTGTSQYLAYTAIHASDNEFTNNTLVGTPSRAYIGVETAWRDASSDGDHYGSGKGSALVDGFANAAMSGVRVSGNTIRGSSTHPAVMLGQIGTFGLTKVDVSDNVAIGPAQTYSLKLVEETSGSLSDCTLRNNNFERSASNFLLPRGQAHFSESHGNGFLNGLTGVFVSFTSGDTTPSVGVGQEFICANAGATSITTFDDGREGQDIVVRLDVNTTIVHNSSLIRCKSSANITGADSNKFVRFRRIDSIWFEMSRNF